MVLRSVEILRVGSRGAKLVNNSELALLPCNYSRPYPLASDSQLKHRRSSTYTSAELGSLQRARGPARRAPSLRGCASSSVVFFACSPPDATQFFGQHGA